MVGIRLGVIGIGVTVITHISGTIHTIGIGVATGIGATIGIGVGDTTITTTTHIITITTAHTMGMEAWVTQVITADTMDHEVETLALRHLRCVEVQPLARHKVLRAV